VVLRDGETNRDGREESAQTGALPPVPCQRISLDPVLSLKAVARYRLFVGQRVQAAGVAEDMRPRVGALIVTIY